MVGTPRPLGREDADEVAAVFSRSRAAAMPWLPVLHTPEEDRAFFAEQLGTAAAAGVDADGRLAGFAIVRDDWLLHLYVDADRRGAGIGSTLLHWAGTQADGRLQLWAFARNEAAIGFYARHGFTVVERTDGHGNEEREPDVRMARTG